MDTKFLDHPIASWKFETNRDFQIAVTEVCALTVTNDPVERAVAFVKFLKQHNFKPQSTQEFKEMVISVDARRSANTPNEEDDELIQWYLDQPNLEYDDGSETSN